MCGGSWFCFLVTTGSPCHSCAQKKTSPSSGTQHFVSGSYFLPSPSNKSATKSRSRLPCLKVFLGVVLVETCCRLTFVPSPWCKATALLGQARGPAPLSPQPWPTRLPLPCPGHSEAQPLRRRFSPFFISCSRKVLKWSKHTVSFFGNG